MRDIQLHIEGMALDYAFAKAIADTAAGHATASPMCIAWYDGQKKEEHPAVAECQRKPGWLSYAEGHGGNIKIDLNDGEFIFIFTSTDAKDPAQA